LDSDIVLANARGDATSSLVVNYLLASPASTNGTKRSLTALAVESVLRDSRQIEVKMIGEAKAIDILLIFENFPVWLVGLEPSRVKNIHILGLPDGATLLDSLIARSFRTDIITRLLGRFGVHRVIYHPSRDTCLGGETVLTQVVSLISGTLHYVDLVVSNLSVTQLNRVIEVVDHHFYGRLRLGRPSGLVDHPGTSRVRWTRRKHESVGGASMFIGLFCSMVRLEPTVTILERTLQHVVDHGIRPKCIKENDPLFSTALNLKDRIHPARLDVSFVYSTRFCCTGWGIPLLNAE
jgi:hypothetical protein